MSRCSPVRLGDLATRTGVDASVISRQVAALQAGDLLAREADPDDGRACRLRMTEHGNAVLTTLRDRRRSLLESAIVDWTEQEGRTFAQLLARLTDDIDRAAPAPATTSGGRP